MVQVGEEKNNLVVYSLYVSLCDEIGRRADFKCPCPKGRVGSNPTIGIEGRLKWF